MAKELLRSSMKISPHGIYDFSHSFRPDYIILFDSSNNKRMDFYPPKKKLKKNLKKYCRKKKYLYLCNVETKNVKNK